ncbi:transmembrane protein 116 [Hemitrygon akajei]|uniref:transmembrane protein 116 n=1 Tax=Hemitrygon akajei TaxID=2704970 RepID=UPI003BF9D17B
MEHLTLEPGGDLRVWSNSSAVEDDWTEFLTALQWIQFSMVVLSMVGSGSIIGYTAFMQLFHYPEMHSLFFLSLIDLLLGLCWLIGALLCRDAVTAQNANCYNLQAVGQILCICSFCYTLNYIWCLFSELRTKVHTVENGTSGLNMTERRARVKKILVILFSLIPVMLMVPVFSIGNGYGCYANYSSSGFLLPLVLEESYTVDQRSACYAVYLYSTITFLITFFFTLLGLVIFLIKTWFLYKLVHMTGYFGAEQWAKIGVFERSIVLYSTAFIFCWAPASILAMVKLLNPMNMSHLYIVLYFLQAFTAPSQGLLNCILYGWTQRLFLYMKQSAYCDADTQTPLLRFQKRVYCSTKSTEVF